MTSQNAEQFLPLVKALSEGKTIQRKDGDEWYDCAICEFCGPPEFYRVKPVSPKECWVLFRKDPSQVTDPFGFAYRNKDSANIACSELMRVVHFVLAKEET